MLESERKRIESNMEKKMNYDEKEIKFTSMLLVFKEIVTKTADESSIHSVPQIFRRKNLVIKGFWIVSFFVFVGICSYLINSSFNKYFSYQVVTKYLIVYENPTLFPTVSICNQNPYMTSKSYEYIKNFFETNNISDVRTLLYNNLSSQIKAFRYIVGVDLRSSNISDQMRKSMGLTLKEMLLTCTYNNQKCSSDDFVWFYDTIYG